MPLAIFILVGLAALAAAMSHLATQSSNSSYREAISVQAFYSADTAAQWALNQLMYPAASRTAADTRCALMSNENLGFNSASMNGCSAVLNCSAAIDSVNSTSIYTVTSEASCGEGELLGQRVIEVRAIISE